MNEKLVLIGFGIVIVLLNKVMSTVFVWWELKVMGYNRTWPVLHRIWAVLIGILFISIGLLKE